MSALLAPVNMFAPYTRDDGVKVSVWSDAWGNWHGRVYGPSRVLTSEPVARAVARQAIRAELTERSAPGTRFIVRLRLAAVVTDTDPIRTGLLSVESGQVSWEFVERS